MRALVAAGGSGTRMLPITRWLNKHLIPLCNGELMIDKPLQFLKAHAFEEVTVVTGANHAAQIVEYVADGERYGFKRVEYAFQSKPAGIADILNRVSHENTQNGVLLILGDNYFSSIQTSILHLSDYPSFAAAWEFDLGDPELAKRFGQADRDESGRPVAITEKPKNPTHGRILTGLYFFPSDVFEHVAKLSPSARNELEITHLLEMYMREKRLVVHEVEGKWADLGEWPELLNFIVSQK
jgi:glucose-1-phosphate thymidylyltransferase